MGISIQEESGVLLGADGSVGSGVRVGGRGVRVGVAVKVDVAVSVGVLVNVAV